MTTIQRTKYLSQIALNFNYVNYLNSENKQLVVFEIDTVNRTYLLHHGDNFDNILEQSNCKFLEAKAGYLFDIQSQLQTTQNADLLLLSEIVLNSNPSDLDTIIIHELVHFLIDSDRQNQISISDEAFILGTEVYGLTDYPNEYITKHTIDFCNSLAQCCITYNNKTNNFSDGLQTIKSAMRYDIFED